MSYYNPEVYDPKKLLGEDAAVMEGFSLCGQMVLDWLDETAEGIRRDIQPGRPRHPSARRRPPRWP